MKTPSQLKITSLVCAMLALPVASLPALAAYPEKPIEVVIPYGPGSNTDGMGRILINSLRKAMNADLVPINIDGAGGTIGTAKAAAAPADGYTLSFNPVATVTIQPHLRPLPYGKDSFEPVCMVVDNATSITVAPDSPYKTMDDLINAAKKGKVVAVGGAPGSIPHIVQAAVAKAYGVKFVYLPAGGGAKAAKSVLGGEAAFAADTSAMSTTHGLRTLAVLADKRLPELPDAPTMKELGKDLNISIWFGLFAPKGTPDAVLQKLSSGCQAAIKDPEFKNAMDKADFTVRFMDRVAFKTFFNKEFDANKSMLDLIGVKGK